MSAVLFLTFFRITFSMVLAPSPSARPGAAATRCCGATWRSSTRSSAPWRARSGCRCIGRCGPSEPHCPPPAPWHRPRPPPRPTRDPAPRHTRDSAPRRGDPNPARPRCPVASITMPPRGPLHRFLPPNRRTLGVLPNHLCCALPWGFSSQKQIRQKSTVLPPKVF